MKIVGITGKAGAGKDTAAAFLIENYGFQRIAFGDALKEAAVALDPLVSIGDTAATHEGISETLAVRLSELVELNGMDEAKQLPDVRRLLQRLGTEVGRELWGENFWVERAVAKIDPEAPGVVFTDVRFINEAHAVAHGLGGLLVEIQRPDRVELAEGTAIHASEIIDFETHWQLVNDKTPDDLGIALAEVLGLDTRH